MNFSILLHLNTVDNNVRDPHSLTPQTWDSHRPLAAPPLCELNLGLSSINSFPSSSLPQDLGPPWIISGPSLSPSVQTRENHGLLVAPPPYSPVCRVALDHQVLCLLLFLDLGDLWITGCSSSSSHPRPDIAADQWQALHLTPHTWEAKNCR